MGKAWSFCFHEADIGKLATVLKEQYGIDTEPIECCEESIPDIYDRAFTLCSRIGASGMDASVEDNEWGCWGVGAFDTIGGREGATDSSYFPALFSEEDVRQGKMDYLVLDALLHICEEEAGDEKETFNSIITKMETDKKVSTERANQHILLKNYLLPSVFKDILNISWHETQAPDQTTKKETGSSRIRYDIPAFLDRFAYFLNANIRKNPYRSNEKALGFKSLHTFFSFGMEGVYSTYEGKSTEEQLLVDYLMDRMFDVDTVTYLVKRLSKMELAISTTQHLETLVQVLFVPNPFAKKTYLDTMLFVIQENEEVHTKGEQWRGSEETREGDLTRVQREEEHRQKCAEYIRFLAQVYYPVLTSCFYLLFRKSYPKGKDAYVALKSYIEDRHLKEEYDKRIKNRKCNMETLTKDGKDLFVAAYRQLREIICNKDVWAEWVDAMKVDYVSTRRYQEELTMTILKKKCL